MSSELYFKKRNILFVFLIFSLFGSLKAQELNNKSEHEFTVYVMPTMYPLDWSGPSALYKSMMSCYLKTITLPDNYFTQEPVEDTSVDISAASQAGSTGAGARGISSPPPAPPP